MSSNIYLYVGVASSVLFLIKLALLLVAGEGGDTDVEFDLAEDAVGSESFELISFQSIMAFLMFFGWSGMALQEEYMMTKGVTLVLSSVIGFVGSLGFSYAFFRLRKMSSPGVQSLVFDEGKHVEVYSNIPPSKEGYGQVKVIHNNQTHYLNAYTDDDVELKTGKVVYVKSNNPLIVTEKKGV